MDTKMDRGSVLNIMLCYNDGKIRDQTFPHFRLNVKEFCSWGWLSEESRFNGTQCVNRVAISGKTQSPS